MEAKREKRNWNHDGAFSWINGSAKREVWQAKAFRRPAGISHNALLLVSTAGEYTTIQRSNMPSRAYNFPMKTCARRHIFYFINSRIV